MRKFKPESTVKPCRFIKNSYTLRDDLGAYSVSGNNRYLMCVYM